MRANPVRQQRDSIVTGCALQCALCGRRAARVAALCTRALPEPHRLLSDLRHRPVTCRSRVVPKPHRIPCPPAQRVRRPRRARPNMHEPTAALCMGIPGPRRTRAPGCPCPPLGRQMYLCPQSTLNCALWAGAARCSRARWLAQRWRAHGAQHACAGQPPRAPLTLLGGRTAGTRHARRAVRTPYRRPAAPKRCTCSPATRFATRLHCVSWSCTAEARASIPCDSRRH